MNESQEFELVTTLLWELANSNYVEGLSLKEKIISMSNSNDINIEIKQVNGLAEINARNALNNVTVSIPPNSLNSLLERLGLMDKKLESKLDFLFTKNTTFMNRPEAIQVSIELLIDSTFPELKGNVNVKIADNREEIVLYIRKGFKDDDFINAFPALIMRKSFFDNCKFFGVRKLIFIDETNKTFDEIVIDTYDTSSLL